MNLIDNMVHKSGTESLKNVLKYEFFKHKNKMLINFFGNFPHAPTNKKSLLYAGFFVGNFASGKFEPGGWRNKKCQSNDIF